MLLPHPLIRPIQQLLGKPLHQRHLGLPALDHLGPVRDPLVVQVPHLLLGRRPPAVLVGVAGSGGGTQLGRRRRRHRRTPMVGLLLLLLLLRLGVDQQQVPAGRRHRHPEVGAVVGALEPADGAVDGRPAGHVERADLFPGQVEVDVVVDDEGLLLKGVGLVVALGSLLLLRRLLRLFLLLLCEADWGNGAGGVGIGGRGGGGGGAGDGEASSAGLVLARASLTADLLALRGCAVVVAVLGRNATWCRKGARRGVDAISRGSSWPQSWWWRREKS